MSDIYEAARYSSAAPEASHVIKPGKGILLGFFAFNGNGASRFIQVFDSATVPADTAVPALVFAIAANGTLQPTMPGVGIDFQNGIAICNSTTGSTKTIGAADSLFCVIYG